MMIDDATRNSVADQLEHDAVYLDGSSERQKIPVAQMVGPVGAVVRDDGVRFESAGAAALATYGYCGSSNIVRAVRTGCKAGGHYWKRADEEDK